MTKENFYITTTLPYVNADPHIGFALEIIQADIIARYQASLGKEVFFNTGTDEHGQKIYQNAIDEKRDPQEYVDFYAAKFDDLKEKLNLSYNNFIRTTDPDHVKAAQEFWKRCEENGDIYKDNYSAKYCVGCELEKQESDLVDGRCPIHPDREIDIIEEENYFFKFSKYEKELLRLFDENPDFVKPAHRQKEIRNFVDGGLQDFSISRLKEKMPWGVPVPGDDNHVMYVWFDALVNYISCLGWPKDNERFEKFWGTTDISNAIQVAGKDNLRQQTAMWQAMLMSAGLPNSKQVFIHGFINIGGQKVSKSAGTKLPSPFELVDRYGTDALRYYLVSEIPSYEDGDFSEERFDIKYTELANDLGNLVSRVTNIADKNEIEFVENENIGDRFKIDKDKYGSLVDSFEFNKTISLIWEVVVSSNKYVEEEKPWELKDDKDRLTKVINDLLNSIKNIAMALSPFMPEASGKILDIFKNKNIEKAEPLFPRIEKSFKEDQNK